VREACCTVIVLHTGQTHYVAITSLLPAALGSQLARPFQLRFWVQRVGLRALTHHVEGWEGGTYDPPHVVVERLLGVVAQQGVRLSAVFVLHASCAGLRQDHGALRRHPLQKLQQAGVDLIAIFFARSVLRDLGVDRPFTRWCLTIRSTFMPNTLQFCQ
jgi:hypothetical protein